ncbi:hypothetical protein Q5Y75_05305 [Ruegeria sp. 2205SS24-7]|uniref:hypothetical protein n=1 Tax=Ruegeria discodermiae TaxID=3064389 RepID=UPI002741027D|nr:hypothetical protein [Ruegeria sp. 2205SS24-7]MDP5216627.1 hypothetical protein [Ruegeria sp. 2205SS24-7]
MKLKILIAAMALAACDLPPGEGTSNRYAFVSPYGPRVNPVNAQEFEVILGPSGTFDGYWCGASEYARRKLGAGWSDRIYVASPIGPSLTTERSSAVRFTLDPAAIGVTPTEQFFRWGINVGDSMTISQGRTRCETALPIRAGRF